MTESKLIHLLNNNRIYLQGDYCLDTNAITYRFLIDILGKYEPFAEIYENDQYDTTLRYYQICQYIIIISDTTLSTTILVIDCDHETEIFSFFDI